MPCQFSRFRPRLTFASPDPAASPAVGALDAYVANRRTWLYLLRRQTRILVFLFVFLEAIWRGPTELVFGKDFDPKIDYGFVYNVGYFFTWIWTCLFAIIWAAFFEWWVPDLSTPDNADGTPSHGKLERFTCLVNKIDMVILPAAIGVTLAVWSGMVLFTLVGKNSAPLKYTSKLRSAAIILATTAWATSFGYYSLETLARLDVAHVRWEMDAWVLLPIGVNIGVAIGTAFVSKIERKRIARIEANDAERALSVEEFLAEEKTPLFEA